MNLSSFTHLVKEWHPTKNKKLTPSNITYGSNIKVWWLCPKGHSYDSVIHSRTGKRKSGCPYCKGKKTLNYDFWK